MPESLRDPDSYPGTSLSESARFFAGLLALFIVSASISLAAWSTLPALLLGWEATVVTSDSMAPTIRKGDVVAVDPGGVESIGTGTVVLFVDPANSGTVLHRVSSIDPDGRFRTKGDANRLPDSTLVDAKQVVGTARLLVPLGGIPVTWAWEADWLRLSLLAGFALVVLSCSRWALLPAYNPWAPATAGLSERDLVRLAERAAHLRNLFIQYALPAGGPSRAGPSDPSLPNEEVLVRLAKRAAYLRNLFLEETARAGASTATWHSRAP